MSGGFWEYRQYMLSQVADDVEDLINKSGKEKSLEELEESWYSPDWYERFPEDKFHATYPKEVLEEMKNAVKYLTIARVYMHRLDWMLSGDDGEESFLTRLKEDLKEAEEEFCEKFENKPCVIEK